MQITRRQVLAAGMGTMLRGAEIVSVVEVERFAAPEANQAVAVDARSFFAIGNHVIGKYDKRSGKRIALWECEKAKPLIHLNSGVVREGILYCAHSNYPGVPMVSSIEMWDAATLKFAGSYSFGIYGGSATWIDFHGDRRYVTFGNYGNAAGEPGRDGRWTSLTEFDSQWRRLQSWSYPDDVTSRLGQYTISGGCFGLDGRIYCTGHDEPEMFVLSLPRGGSVLKLNAIARTPNRGQGISWDPVRPWTLYSIDRSRREVIVSTVKPGS